MTLSIVDPSSSLLRHLAAVDVKFSGLHIGNGIYFSANHNPNAGADSSTATPQSSLIGQAETHATSEYDYTLPDSGAPWDAYRDDLDTDGTPDFIKAGFDMSLHVGDTIIGGDFYQGPSVPLLIAMDQGDLNGTVHIVGFPSAANALDGMDGTMHESSGTLLGYTEQDIGGDIGGYYTVSGADVVGGMSGSGGYMDLDLDGDGSAEAYAIGTVARSGTDGFGNPLAQLTSFAPHYAELAAAIEGLSGAEARGADGFARMTLLSGQTLGSSATTVTGTLFHENLFGGINADTSDGAGGDDNLVGGAAADSLTGGTGADTLDGGTGDDTLTGGTGADRFSGFGLGATDHITDFNEAEDYIDLSDFFSDLAEVQSASIDQPGGDVLVDLSMGSGVSAAGGGLLLIENFTIAQMTAPSMMVMCFVAGTRIETAQGPRPIEALKPGDLIQTARGFARLRIVHQQRFKAARLAEDSRLRPVEIGAGALGPGVPAADLRVSRQHRILVNGAKAIAENSALVAAHHLTALPQVEELLESAEITYFHLGFDRHELIVAEGCWAESFRPGDFAFSALPEVAARHYARAEARAPCPAAPILRGKQAKQLIAKHLRLGCPLQAAPRQNAAARWRTATM